MGQAFRKLFDTFFGNSEMRVDKKQSPIPLSNAIPFSSRFHFLYSVEMPATKRLDITQGLPVQLRASKAGG
ncbi:hypothetical protein HAX54_034590, partial [Datura stramonium]|nr:hypothetical protein [Datura stramonium]